MDLRTLFAVELLTEKVTPLFFDWAANPWRSLPFLDYFVRGLQDLGIRLFWVAVPAAQ